MNYTPSKQITKLRDRAITNPPELRRKGYHLYNYFTSFCSAENRNLPYTVRHAKAYANVIRTMPLFVYKDDILAGEHFDTCEVFIPNSMPVKDAVEYIETSTLPIDLKIEARKIIESEPEHFKCLKPSVWTMPDVAKAVESGTVSIWGVSHNHSIRGYEKVINLGFNGIKAEVEKSLNNLDPFDVEFYVKRQTLESWMEVCDACIDFGKRYADYLLELASKTDNKEEKANYLAMAKMCEVVPANPATTFKEAVQSLWFAHIFTIWEDGSNANGIGRLDQFLYPLYKKDIESSVMTDDDAREILAAFWIKLYFDYDVQQTMVGGQHADGTDATNDLSYLCFDVTEALGFIRCMSARIHKNSTDKFLSRCVDLFALGGGIPFFFNDEALIPALTSKGVSIEDARGYAAIGCVEITIPGKAYPHAVSNWINLSKVLELTINNGYDMITGEKIGIDVGNLADFKSIKEIKAAYDKEFEYFVNMVTAGSNLMEAADRDFERLPYLSLLTDDCISKAHDITNGGARYNYHSSAAVAIPNVGDAFTALDHLLFKDKVIDAKTLLTALKNDFSGNEELYDYIVNKIDKYGNDLDEPDMWVSQIAKEYCEKLGEHKTISGGSFFCHLFSFTLMIEYGKKTAASADGRRSGAPLAYSVSPGQGRDIDSITATIKSLSKIDHKLVAASSSAILEIDPSLIEDQGKESLVALLRTSINLGVGQLQFNAVSAEKLVEAKNNPDRYPHLAVRVSGFSQKFCLLDNDMQDHIIHRTKHKK